MTIPEVFFQTLIDTMPRRVAAVIAAKGNGIMYRNGVGLAVLLGGAYEGGCLITSQGGEVGGGGRRRGDIGSCAVAAAECKPVRPEAAADHENVFL